MSGDDESASKRARTYTRRHSALYALFGSGRARERVSHHHSLEAAATEAASVNSSSSDSRIQQKATLDTKTKRTIHESKYVYGYGL